MSTETARATPIDAKNEAMLGKIAKLWRSASGRGATPAEREAAERLALKLMAQYHVTQAQLDAEVGDDVLDDHEITPLLKGPYRAPFEALFAALCELYTCRAWFLVRGNTSIGCAYGFANDAARVRLMWELLYADCARAQQTKRGRNAAATRTARRNFVFGYTDRVTERLQDVLAEVLIETDQSDRATAASTGGTASPSVALVLADRKEQVDQGFDAKALRSRGRAPKPPSLAGYIEGRTAGDQVDLGAGERLNRPAPQLSR